MYRLIQGALDARDVSLSYINMNTDSGLNKLLQSGVMDVSKHISSLKTSIVEKTIKNSVTTKYSGDDDVQLHIKALTQRLSTIENTIDGLAESVYDISVMVFSNSFLASVVMDIKASGAGACTRQ